MESRAKFLGHSVHQQLIVLPLGLLGGAVAFDLLALALDHEQLAVVAFWTMIAGIITGLIAAPFGTIDWLAIPRGTRAKRIGMMHALANVVALILFGISAWLRYDAPEDPSTTATILSTVALASSLLGGWLGGELVSRLGVGVDDGANLNSSNSLTRREART